MSRYKGQLKVSRTEQEFPHRVEIIVPRGGFGKRLDAMHDWHRARRNEGMSAFGTDSGSFA
jgi:hypothetical protein